LFGCCWYEAIDRKKGAAYKQLSVEQLQEAIKIAEAIIDRPDSYIQHGAFSVRSRFGWEASHPKAA
jgi:hypothetical protein